MRRPQRVAGVQRGQDIRGHAFGYVETLRRWPRPGVSVSPVESGRIQPELKKLASIFNPCEISPGVHHDRLALTRYRQPQVEANLARKMVVAVGTRDYADRDGIRVAPAGVLLSRLV